MKRIACKIVAARGSFRFIISCRVDDFFEVSLYVYHRENISGAYRGLRDLVGLSIEEYWKRRSGQRGSILYIEEGQIRDNGVMGVELIKVCGSFQLKDWDCRIVANWVN